MKMKKVINEMGIVMMVPDVEEKVAPKPKPKPIPKSKDFEEAKSKVKESMMSKVIKSAKKSKKG